jgi:hypothetical protein
LTAILFFAAEESDVHARCLKAFTAKFASAVAPSKWRNDGVARTKARYFRADLFDDADELVPGASARFWLRHAAIEPQVRAANSRARDPHDRIFGIDDPRIWNGFKADIMRAVVDCCFHD